MRRVFLLTAACCVLAGPALAGGGVDLYGVYGDVIDGEWEFGLGARLSLGGTHWMVDAAATGFLEVEGVEGVPEVPSSDETVKYRSFDLGLRYLFYNGHKLRPYLGGGASYAQVSAIYVDVDGGLGFYGLAGLRYGNTPGINFMAELIYRWAEVQATYGLVNQQDVTVGGLALQVGISFIF
jgi:hypothetical protein